MDDLLQTIDNLQLTEGTSAMDHATATTTEADHPNHTDNNKQYLQWKAVQSNWQTIIKAVDSLKTTSDNNDTRDIQAINLHRLAADLRQETGGTRLPIEVFEAVVIATKSFTPLSLSSRSDTEVNPDQLFEIPKCHPDGGSCPNCEPPPLTSKPHQEPGKITWVKYKLLPKDDTLTRPISTPEDNTWTNL